MTKKKIEVVTLKAKDIKTGFGNPRKITKKKMEELEASMDLHGDFGIYLIDESDNIIAGNQRLQTVMKKNPEQELLCKRLVGYSKSELRAINIKDNTHAGEWDLDMLADWTADLNMDLGIDEEEKEPEERTISEMELIHYEKYNFVLICCRNELDYNNLLRKLDLENKKIKIAKTRKIAARAVWFDDIASKFKDEDETGD